MSEQNRRASFGPYRLVRDLAPCRLGDRWMALHEHRQTSHTAYEFAICHDRLERRRFAEAMQALSTLSHPHILPVDMWSFEPGGAPWAVTHYTGNHGGLVTLEDVVRAKGESLPAFEAERAALQLLEATAAAHDKGVYHGPVTAQEILVDRHGSLTIEMYGVTRTIAGLGRGNFELAADETRSIVELAYRLLTGLPADEPRIAPSRIAKRVPRAFEEWLEEGLNPGAGFENAAEAISRLPSQRTEIEPSRVKTVLGRIRAWSK